MHRLDPTEWGLHPQAQIYRAGDLVPPGRYGRVDRPGTTVTLARVDYLAPSFDGTVAVYVRVQTVSDLFRDHPVAISEATSGREVLSPRPRGPHDRR